MISDEIGAVAIGRNEGQRLIDCLNSVKTKVRWVVYVDSGSTDGSSLVAERLHAHVVNLDMSRPYTAARARNEGVAVLRELRPDIRLIQFVDGDCELDDAWLDLSADFMRQRNDVAVVCGRRRERHPSASVYNRLCDLEWDTPIGQTTACGGDSLVRAEAFESVGRFRAELIAGEEPELCLRLREKGWKIWRLDAEMTRHDAAIKRFVQWWLRTVRWGFGMAEVSRLHWRSPLGIWKEELMRTVIWGGILPSLIILGALMHFALLALMLIYPLQICRIAIARGPLSSMSWIYASFVTLAKFAEFQGILMFYWRSLNHQSKELIEYKIN